MVLEINGSWTALGSHENKEVIVQFELQTDG